MDASSSSNNENLLKDTNDKSTKMFLQPSSKVFKFRKPLLEDLYEKGQLPMYNFISPIIAALSMVLIIVYFIIYDEYSRHFDFFLSYILSEIQNLPTCFALQIAVLCLAAFMVFASLLVWQCVRPLFKNKGLVDNFALACWATFCVLYFILPYKFVAVREQPFSSRAAFATLQVHWLMKLHSYIRENIPKVLYFDTSFKDHEKPTDLLLMCKKLIYFICVPTAIYRDSYPMTKNIDWRKCVQYYVGVWCAIILPMAALLMYYTAWLLKCQSETSVWGKTVDMITYFIFSIIFLFVIQPYGIFHSFYNFVAELTMFGDRMFYMDWWNATSPYDLSQKWSFPVYEWLHYYVYMDCRNVLQLSKQTAAFITFVISAIGHDYIFAIAFGFSVPVCSLGVLVYLILLPSTFQRKKTIPTKTKRQSGTKLWIGFICYYFTTVLLHQEVICDRMKCPLKDEPSWINIIYSRVLPC